MTKRIMFDFRCRSCDATFEALTNTDPAGEPVACPECSSTDTKRLISPVRFDTIGMVTDGKSSSDGLETSIDRWVKLRRSKMKIEQRNMERHGTVR